MRKLAVTELHGGGVINASEGWLIPPGEEDADLSELNEVLAP
jgi:hypothetical protein